MSRPRKHPIGERIRGLLDRPTRPATRTLHAHYRRLGLDRTPAKLLALEAANLAFVLKCILDLKQRRRPC